ncbi:MAG: DUF4340 domain-containing protein [Planctomycetes bacterium]|nr:DUF4340 domain-containing protein [Planctomycetota bacterium]
MKTGVILGAAAVLTVLATMSGPKAVKQDLFSDQGELFFPQFTDSTAAVELEVTEFSEERATARKFAVRRDKDGRWTIPSHGGYPADAKDRMGKAAAMLIGLTKARSVSDRVEDQVDFGVVDPLDESADTVGRGTRITMRDSAGNDLADLILGKEVDGKLDIRYVRQPGKRRTYSTKIDGELSTKFADWIETDLLKATSYDLQKVIFDNYSVDEVRRAIVPGDKFDIAKDKDGKWTIAGLDVAKEEPNTEKMTEIQTALTGIKIVGVRTKPDGLTARLEQATGFDRMLLSQSLADKGYFLGQGGKLFSNEGDLLFETKKGVRYTLRFGELVPGSADEVSSGDAAPATPQAGENGPQPVAADNRYLMVTAEFDEALLSRPQSSRLPKEHMEKRRQARQQIEKITAAIDGWRTAHDNALPESLIKLTEKPESGEAPLAELPKDPWDNDYQLQVNGESFAVISQGEDKAPGGDGAAADIDSSALQHEDDLRRQDDEWTAFDKKVEDGRAEADKLTRRFGPWYYVIDKALFDKLKPKRADLIKAKAAEPADDGGK